MKIAFFGAAGKTASAVARLSPVAITIRMPRAWRARMASCDVALIGSATTNFPARRPSIVMKISVRASLREEPAPA